jgi:TRAP transporter 4TM/12TM fusion protein
VKPRQTDGASRDKKGLDMEKDQREDNNRYLNAFFSILAAGTSIFYLYTAYFGQVTPMVQRGVILLTCLAFCYIYRPMRSPRGWTFYLDCLFALLSMACICYLMWREMILLSILVGEPMDLAVGVIILILILEATRRTLGWPFVIISVFFLFYGKLGPYMPETIRHAGFKWDYILTWITLTPQGVFGVAMYVCSTVIVLFIAFSAFLRTSGAIKFFTDIPYAIFGMVRGGPAKMAVIASSFMGTLTGSVVANVTATGSFTIPLMKRTGYTPYMAGAIEAAASSGGQIMPPVMGTAAFVMADILGISYWDVCVAAFLPAVLYYVSLFVTVDLEAVKAGIKGLPRKELPNLKSTIISGWFIIPPLGLLLLLLSQRWSPMKACLYAIILVTFLSIFSKEYRMGIRKINQALIQTIKDMVLVTIACAAAGIIIGMVGLTGLGAGIATLLESLAGGNILILLVLSMVVCIILGMGMTTLAAYLILALLVAPVLVKLGVVPIAAHLFIFYFGSLSLITPPVAIGAYAAAAVAGSQPMQTGFAAWRIALIAFIVPYFFVFNPALVLQGSPEKILLAAFTAIFGTVCFGMMIQGYLYFHGKLHVIGRILIGLGGLGLIYPEPYTDLIGAGLVGAVILFYKVLSRLRPFGPTT